MVTNYFYAKTPYFYPVRVVGIAALVLPALLVWYFSAKIVLQNPNKKQFFRSLHIPAVFAVASVFHFFLVMDPELGWEYTVGLQLLVIEIVFVFAVSFIVNGIILKRNTPIS